MESKTINGARKINFAAIPEELQEYDQWVLWKSVVRDGKATKMPLSVCGSAASSTDPETWTSFDNVVGTYDESQHSGIGFVFYAPDDVCGIDLDGCRDPETGVVADWAEVEVLRFDSYTEISPSQTGLKIWIFCDSRLSKGRKRELRVPRISDKTPAVEVYTQGRYFAMTGWVYKHHHCVNHRESALQDFLADHWPATPAIDAPQHDWRSDDAVVERARKYVARIPGAVSGSSGHNATFHVACTLVKGFALSTDQAFDVISEWNAKCDPPWSEHELNHKIESATKASGEVGYLRNAKTERWDAIRVPTYQPVTMPAGLVMPFSVGQRVRAGDRDNIGTVVEDSGGPTVFVSFRSLSGFEARKPLPREQLQSLDGKASALPRSFAGLDASELAQYATLEADWLVQDVFTIDEPLLVGARSKGCKTLQLTDLAVAIASGTQWMNIFEVPKRRKVLFITGEANYRRISKHIEKACKVRGICFADLKGFLRVEAVEFPCLPRLADQEGIRKDIETHESEVVMVDPLYRGLSGLDTSRLSEMGDAIKSFQAACQPACMVLSHHVIKSAAREYGSAPQLEDMTGAGIAESCGQWWLVGRNTKYEWNWQHDLCVQYGGREGQGGGRRILFNERDWTFQVDSWNEYTEQAREEVVQRRHEARLEADERKRAAARMMILKAVRNVKTPQSKSSIRESCGAVQADFRVVFPELLQEMTLVQRPYRDALNRRQPVGYLLKDYVAEYDQKEADAVEKQITEQTKSAPEVSQQDMLVDAG